MEHGIVMTMKELVVFMEVLEGEFMIHASFGKEQANDEREEPTLST